LTLLQLTPEESPPDHEFAATKLYQCDLPLLNYLLQDLRSLMRSFARDALDIAPHQNFTWTVHDLNRRTIVCDPDRLLTSMDVKVVGFFGDRRTDADMCAVDRIENLLHEEFRTYPGILSYSSAELIDDQWVDLVVHRAPSDRDEWRTSKVHVHAVDQLAPEMYHSVRIHNGNILGGPIGSEPVVIESTKYWDYDASPVWHAMRDLPSAVAETLASETVVPTAVRDKIEGQSRLW
jgi:hypothetical protein